MNKHASLLHDKRLVIVARRSMKPNSIQCVRHNIVCRYCIPKLLAGTIRYLCCAIILKHCQRCQLGSESLNPCNDYKPRHLKLYAVIRVSVNNFSCRGHEKISNCKQRPGDIASRLNANYEMYSVKSNN